MKKISIYLISIGIFALILTWYVLSNLELIVQPNKSDNNMSFTKLEITIGDSIDSRTILPIVITQVTSSDKPLDRITKWYFLPTHYDEINPINKTGLDFLPNILKIGLEVQDEHGNNAIDTSQQSEFASNSALYHTTIFCGKNNEKINIFYGQPVTVPIKSGLYKVFAKNAENELLPNKNGEYTLGFASFFEQEIKLPKNAIILSMNHEYCSSHDSKKAYYDKVTFRLGH